METHGCIDGIECSVRGRSREAAQSRRPARSDSTKKSQSEGLLTSVLRGKENALLQNRREKMIAAGALLVEAMGCNGDETETRAGPNITDGSIESARGGSLEFSPFGDKAEIDIAIRRGVAAGVGAEEDDLLEGRAASIAVRQRASVSRSSRSEGGRFSRRSFTAFPRR